MVTFSIRNLTYDIESNTIWMIVISRCVNNETWEDPAFSSSGGRKSNISSTYQLQRKLKRIQFKTRLNTNMKFQLAKGKKTLVYMMTIKIGKHVHHSIIQTTCEWSISSLALVVANSILICFSCNSRRSFSSRSLFSFSISSRRC